MVSCILLAAGESKRFGSPKPLAQLGQMIVIEHIQRSLLLTPLDEIIVVLGAQADAVAPHILKNPCIKSVVNRDYAQGQTSSFKTGLNAVQPSAVAVAVLPVDVPLVRPQTFDLLIDTFAKANPLILVPACNGRNGHPPVFSMSLKEEFMTLENDEPLSSIQHRHSDAIVRLPVDDEGVVLSFNTPEELKELIKRLRA